MRSIAALLLPTLAFVTTASAASPGPSPDPMGKLGVFEGRWHYTGRIYETPYSHAHSDSGSVDCNWAPNRGFMICDYGSDDPPHNNLSIFSYSRDAKAYTHVLINGASTPTLDNVTQNGNTWTTSRQVQYEGKTLISRIVFVFPRANEQVTTVQVSADEGRSWTKTIETTAIKDHV